MFSNNREPFCVCRTRVFSTYYKPNVIIWRGFDDGAPIEVVPLSPSHVDLVLTHFPTEPSNCSSTQPHYLLDNTLIWVGHNIWRAALYNLAGRSSISASALVIFEKSHRIPVWLASNRISCIPHAFCSVSGVFSPLLLLHCAHLFCHKERGRQITGLPALCVTGDIARPVTHTYNEQRAAGLSGVPFCCVHKWKTGAICVEMIRTGERIYDQMLIACPLLTWHTPCISQQASRV